MSDDEEGLQNRNPAIERMMAILTELEKTPSGLSLKRLAERTGVTRSTVYRILNSLEAHDMVRQVDRAQYVLGARLLSLADGVTSTPVSREIAEKAQPHLDRLAATFGESCKVSVYDRGFVLVIAAATGHNPYALHAAIGQHLPIHAGAGSKVLLAHQPEAEIEAVLSHELKRYTVLTFVDPEALRAELALVRARGWSRDGGEFAVSVNAYGAPIVNLSGQVVAAISIPFLVGQDAEYEDKVRNIAMTTAIAIGSDLT
ncbi:IclR family transcriptional regulator [Kaistia sp. 32K]|uniref:IclR family transcriptional regulator n=1 Tax=Kaistia sp. 32K TaxID=2795690 RepID=UPI0019166D83|nr:IclR family transcriptional regulator [Kaistia sp. 32K]BCP52107.1 IclR family transcriptional regulator [Kaistia sp. 32K]